MNRYPDYKRAVRLAYRTLLHLKVDKLPIDIVSICRQCKNTIIISYSKAEPFATMLGLNLVNDAPSEMAFTYRIEPVEGPVVHLLLYNDEPYQNAARLRFTLAHELGHIVLKHKGSSYIEEAEANCFAQHLLCPEPLVKSLQEISVNECILAATFGVSISTARIVLSEKNRSSIIDPQYVEMLHHMFQILKYGPGVLIQGVFENLVSAKGL